MGNCSIHPGTKSVTKINGTDLCEKCKTGIEAAIKAVDKHVSPKDCFVWYEGTKTGWQPIEGTGCAHWVAHEQGIKRGSKSEQCMLGFTFRVPTLLGGKSQVKLEEVKVDDLYVNPNKDHTGIVIKVSKDKPPKITIRHDSSGQGKVAENEFATYFKGKGMFYR